MMSTADRRPSGALCSHAGCPASTERRSCPTGAVPVTHNRFQPLWKVGDGVIAVTRRRRAARLRTLLRVAGPPVRTPVKHFRTGRPAAGPQLSAYVVDTDTRPNSVAKSGTSNGNQTKRQEELRLA